MAFDANRTTPLSGPVAHLTGCYPMASHTFIQRDIAALPEFGARITTMRVRAPAADHLTGPEERDAAAETTYILRRARKPAVLLRAGLQLIATSRRTVATLALAARTARPVLNGALWQVFYVIEAAILTRHLKDDGIRHLHNHFADPGCTLAMLTARLSRTPFSFTLHGPSDIFEPKSWHLNEKIARAARRCCFPIRCIGQNPASSIGVSGPLSLTVTGDGPERAHARSEVARIGEVSPMKRLSKAMIAVASKHKRPPCAGLV